jgi:pimeloyl-ACP methyl ester carboxylesterase
MAQRSVAENSVPLRPGARQERLSMGLFLHLSPHLPPTQQPAPREELAPFETVTVPRRNRSGTLTAIWFPAERPRGAVLLLPPWLVWGKAYFHLRGRIQALRAAGYHVLTLDFPGFGGSGPVQGFFDRDVEDGLDFLRRRAGDLPLHVWGVSAGGTWAHLALSRVSGVAGAMFEDVSPHLLEWSWRMFPLWRPGFLFFRTCFRSAYRFLDARRHAAAMPLAAVTYVSGEQDRGVRPLDTGALAAAAGGRCRIVPGAGHLGAIKVAAEEILALALDTFRRAEEEPRDGPALREVESADCPSLEGCPHEACPVRL